MNVLALDTATEVSSVAVHNGENTFCVESDSRKQSRSLLEIVEQQLSHASLRLNELDLIVFDKGPGSFTGMRIATGVAQGLSYGLGITVVGISSLLAMAYATRAERVAVAIDARMGEIYFGCFQRDAIAGMFSLCEESVLPPDAAVVPEQQKGANWVVAGTGWRVYESEIRNANSSVRFYASDVLYPKASILIELALLRNRTTDHNNASLALPSYVRNKVAKKAGGNY